jgi:hypothetical protein
LSAPGNLRTIYAARRSPLYQIYRPPANLSVGRQIGKAMLDIAFIIGLLAFFAVFYVFSLACNRL